MWFALALLVSLFAVTSTSVLIWLIASTRGRSVPSGRSSRSSDDAGNRGREPLEILYDGPQAEVDIIAVHGLGSNVDWAWVWKGNDRPVNWLRDSDMLPKKIPNSRIIAYNYDSRWHYDAPKTRLQSCGKDLVYSLQRFRMEKESRPLIFIGHSLGGLVICHALLFAEKDLDIQDIVQDTIGFISLGTPFGGTNMQRVAQWVANAMVLAGSQSTLIRELTFDNLTLWDKLQEFCRLQKRQGFRTFCFYEIYKTDYGKRFYIPGLIQRIVVNEKSACVAGWGNQELYTDHLKINKFSGPSDRSFLSVSHQIQLIIDSRQTEIEPQVNDDAVNIEMFEAIEAKVDLNKLKIAEGAEYNSFADSNTSLCLEDTRVELIRQILDWANDPGLDSKNIFWLCGIAGTGKSTISRTVSHLLDEKQNLGATFFFKRGAGDRGNASRVFSTIASQLADKLRGSLWKSMAKALSSDSTLCDKNLREQFDKLILQPLQDAARQNIVFPRRIIVIDALDECDVDDHVRTILKLLGGAQFTSLGIRVFVTSRPELLIVLGFKNDIGGDLHKNVKLEDIEPETIDHDIRLYLQHSLQNIKEYDDSINMFDRLPADWPDGELVESLVQLADHLFIYASTVCRFISTEDDPRESLDNILQHRSHGRLTDLETMYSAILDRVASVEHGQQDSRQALCDFQELIGSIVLLADTLSLTALCTLLGLRPRKVARTLKQLQSILQVPEIDNAPIRLHHLSFRDFLVNSQTRTCNRYHVDEAKTHERLAARCLWLLNQPGALRDDICNLNQPGIRRADIASEDIANSIAVPIRYACSYWVQHTIGSGKELKDNCIVHQFLVTHFLHWLEVLSWLGRLSEVVSFIGQLRSAVKRNEGLQLSLFLEDAQRFLLRNRRIVDLAPLQLYSSALYFTPMGSVVRQTFEDKAKEVFIHLPEVTPEWGAEIMRLEGHEGYISEVIFSPAGDLLASTSSDHTVRLWNVYTGDEMQIFRPHDGEIREIVFALDGKILMSVSIDGIVRQWDVKTGEEILRLDLKISVDLFVTFSPDRNIIATALHDYSLQLWNTQTGQKLHRLRGHKGTVLAIRYSPNGKVIASGSSDNTVRLWGTQTGEEIQKLEGHDTGVSEIAFSADGKMLLSRSHNSPRQTGKDDEFKNKMASENKTFRLWNTETGEQIRKVAGHKAEILRAIFSPDGQTIATISRDEARLWNSHTGEVLKTLEVVAMDLIFCSDGKTIALPSFESIIWLWDVETGETIMRLKHGHIISPDCTAVAFSPDGKILASALDDKTVRLWSLRTIENTETRKLEGEKDKKTQRSNGHNRTVSAVAFSPDGKTIASTSWDTTTRLWDSRTGEEIKNLGENVDRRMSSLVFSTDGNMIASASYYGNVRVWDVRTKTQLCNLEGRPCVTRTSVFSWDGTTIAIVERNETWLWDVQTGKMKQRLQTQCLQTHIVVFSPDGNMLASELSNEGIQLWNVRTGEKMQKLQGLKSRLRDMVFSPDGKFLALALKDKMVRLWNAETGEQIASWKTEEVVERLTFKPDVVALRTNAVTFHINLVGSCLGKTWLSKSKLQLRGQWVCYDDQEILWLPLEYRGSCWAALGDMLVIGQMSGAMSFFQLFPQEN